MESIVNAQSHAEVANAGVANLQGVLAAAPLPKAIDDELTSARNELLAAGNAIGMAVTAAASAVEVNDKKAKQHYVKDAEARVDDAEKRNAQARASLRAAQNEPAAAVQAGAVLNLVTGALADSERATAAAKAAARQAATQLQPLRNPIVQVVAIVVLTVVAIGLWIWRVSPTTGQQASVVFAAIVLGVAMLLLALTGGEHGVLSPIVGADNRVSTSKTQLGLWTIFLALALAFLLGRVVWDNADIGVVLNEQRVDEYLILIGGPFAATVLAKLAVSWKTESGRLQKTTATETSPVQAVEDDSGNASLIDSQYLIFNCIALGYFVVETIHLQVLPEIPPVLFGLTSVSAATYTANKLAESNAPVITAVSPRSCLPGGQIRVSGYNFVAGTEATDTIQVVVLIEGYAHELKPRITESETELWIDLPGDVPAGTRGLTVRTAARSLSAPFLIEVLPNAPVLLGLEVAARVGQQVRAKGTNLLTPGTQAPSEPVNVRVGGVDVLGTATLDTVVFDIPSSLAPNTDVQLTISRAGVTSVPITVHVS